jgi:uncharacterized protein YecT (DUF1311 family)
MIFALVLAAGASSAVLDCNDPMGTSQINECANRRLQSATVTLNTQWAIAYKFVKTTDAKYATILLASQRAWLRYRDEQCRAEARFLEGSLHPELVEADCKAHLSLLRAGELKAIAEGE